MSWNLLTIPQEMQEAIIARLPSVFDLGALLKTCAHFAALFKNQSIWREHLEYYNLVENVTDFKSVCTNLGRGFSQWKGLAQQSDYCDTFIFELNPERCRVDRVPQMATFIRLSGSIRWPNLDNGRTTWAGAIKCEPDVFYPRCKSVSFSEKAVVDESDEEIGPDDTTLVPSNYTAVWMRNTMVGSFEATDELFPEDELIGSFFLTLSPCCFPEGAVVPVPAPMLRTGAVWRGIGHDWLVRKFQTLTLAIGAAVAEPSDPELSNAFKGVLNWSDFEAPAEVLVAWRANRNTVEITELQLLTDPPRVVEGHPFPVVFTLSRAGKSGCAGLYTTSKRNKYDEPIIGACYFELT